MPVSGDTERARITPPAAQPSPANSQAMGAFLDLQRMQVNVYRNGLHVR